MTTLHVQSILYQNEPRSIRRALDNLRRAADLAIAAGLYQSVAVAYGDCSPFPVFESSEIEALKAENAGYFDFSVTAFGANLGSAKGHNTLLQANAADHVLIMNPDVVLSPRTLIELARPLEGNKLAMVEARQLPIEHPKSYHAETGETPWATTACALIPSALFAEIGPFDSDTFFLYCDDVDFSWRVRLAGHPVLYQPTATVFHDKRLSDDGAWMPSAAEKYYSAEAALLLPYKWSRPDISRELVKKFKGNNLDYLNRAALEFERREREGVLPTPLDPNHEIAGFFGDLYAVHRFAL